MKRRILLTAAAIAAAGLSVPAGADPTVNASVRDSGALTGSFYTGTIGGSGGVFFTRTTSIGPSADPNGLFPIVVDPNDPPEPPVSATSEALQVNGSVGICNYTVFGCSYASFSSLPTGSSLTFGDMPAVGNTMDLTVSLVATGALGSQPITLSITASRPTGGYLHPFAGTHQANPWISGPDVHVNQSSDTPVMTRNGYTVTGSMQTSFGTFPITGGFSFVTRYLHTDAAVDVSLPAQF